MEVHVPRWKERLVLKPREVIVEGPAEEEVAPDIQADMLNKIIDLENELKVLKKELKAKGIQDKIGEDDVERLTGPVVLADQSDR